MYGSRTRCDYSLEVRSAELERYQGVPGVRETIPASFEGYSLHRVTNLKTVRIRFKIAGEVQLVVLLDTYAVLDNRSNNYYTNFARKNLPAP